MRRASLGLLAALASLAAAAPLAAAETIELGATIGKPRPGCPASSDCLAITRTTAYQSRVRGMIEPFAGPVPGRLVAVTVSLGAPTRTQIRAFERNFGGPARFRVSVLAVSRGARSRARLVAQSQVIRPTRFFGTTSTWALDRSLRVLAGQRIALTVPTYLPALATGLGGTNRWKATRRPGRCGSSTDPTPFYQRTALEVLGRSRRVGCTYTGARLTYTATLVPRPVAR